MPPTLRQLTARYLGFGLALSAAIAIALWYWLSGKWALGPWVLAWLAGVNPVTFLWYGWDKSRARSGAQRIPEVVLHLLTAVGGSFGAYLAMQWYRHKTVKGSFRLVFWLLVALQAAVLAMVVKETWF